MEMIVSDSSGPRVFFYCPEPVRAVGGVAVIYDFATALRDHGVDAHVLHDTEGYLYPGRSTEPSVCYSQQMRFTTSDIFVIPEIFGPSWAELITPAHFVIFNQNAHLSFREWDLDETRSDGFTHVYEHPRLLSVICVSSPNQRYIESISGGVPVHLLKYGIDVFEPIDAFRNRELSIAYMPRKRADDSNQVLHLLSLWGELDDVHVHKIDGMSLEQVRRTLSETSIFLSFAEIEGFSLPIMEGLTAGCAVIGYNGSGGADVFTKRTGYPIQYGDVLGFAETTREVLIDIRNDRLRKIERRIRRAQKLMLRERTKVTQARSMVAIWSEVEKAAKVTQSEEEQPLSIDFSKLKTYSRLKRAASASPTA